MVSTMADGWSVDTTRSSFLRVTGNWMEVVDNKWKLQAEVIGFHGVSGEHSGVNLGRYFMQVCEQVGIVNVKKSKVCSITYSTDVACQHLTATLDNTSNNMTMCQTIEDLPLNENFHPGMQAKTNYCRSYFFYRSSWLTFLLDRCLAHVVNLANIDVMGHITKIAAVETSTAIWEYDPSLIDNQVLRGSSDVIAVIQTFTIKVTFSFYF
jgi:hypothetical protein